MKRILALLLVAVFMAQSIEAQAAPTVASVQREIDRLRTLAAEKYEAANEATLKIKALQREKGVLQQREEVIKKELSTVSKVLAKIAISEYQGSGFGKSFELLSYQTKSSSHTVSFGRSYCATTCGTKTTQSTSNPSEECLSKGRKTS